jgi:Tol biopolymer transport system component
MRARAVVAGVVAAASCVVAGPGGASGAQEPPPVLTAGTATVVETLARGDWVQALVPVTLDRPAPTDVTVAYATADGTARAGQPDRDYEPAAGTLTIPAGERAGVIEVSVLGDTRPEEDEELTVALTDPAGATLGTPTGHVVVRERIARGLVVSDVRVGEPDDAGAAKVVATVALSERRPADVTVAWATEEVPEGWPTAAFEGPDFLARSGTAVISAGRLDTRVQLWVRGDAAPEWSEQFRLVVVASSSAVPVADGAGTVTIVDDDAPRPAAYETVSTATDGTVASSNSNWPDVSGDGRYVAFESHGTNLVPRDTNEGIDVFVKDTLTGLTRRVSTTSEGTQAIEPGPDPLVQTGASISADGRHVAFTSNATNLVPGDTNGTEDVFVKDLVTGETIRVSVASDGGQAEGGFGIHRTSISADGRHVAFVSPSPNLVAGDANGVPDAFVHDWATGETRRVSVAFDGAELNGPVANVRLSADGRVVAFSSWAFNAAPSDTDSSLDTFVRDLPGGVTEHVSIGPGGLQGTAGGGEPSLSADGRLVAFTANGLVPGDATATDDVYLRDRLTGEIRLASVASDGRQADRESNVGELSADGGRLAFQSLAHNLAPGDPGGIFDWSRGYVHDPGAGTTVPVTLPPWGGFFADHTGVTAISADGRAVVMVAGAHLVPESGVGQVTLRTLAG